MTTKTNHYAQAAQVLGGALDVLEGADDLLTVLRAIDTDTPYRATRVQPWQGGYMIDMDWTDSEGEWVAVPYPAVTYAEHLSNTTGVHVEAGTDWAMFVPV